MRLLVTGASGFIGRRVCAEAAAAGHGVTALVRPPRGAGRRAAPPAGGDRVVFGRLPYDVPDRAWDDVDALIHCAAATRGEADAEARAINLAGTADLLRQARLRGAAAAEAGTPAPRIVFLSSQSAHADAATPYAKTKREGEAMVRASGLPYAILRPGLVYGPGDAGLFLRMTGPVRSLPFIPLLGGGTAPVQAIEVGDLARAILACAALPDSESGEFDLGDPEPVTLRDFLRRYSEALTGTRKPELTVPMWPIKLGVRVFEALRLPSPVSSDNLRGMELARTMDTAPSLARLGLTLKPLAAGLAEAVGKTPDTTPAPDPALSAAMEPKRVLLVGAGKIGIVHGLNLLNREGIAMAGIVDANAKAFGLYRSMGFPGPFFTDLDEALAATKPHGAVIATPARSHLPLARKLAGAGVAVLVEKPLAVNAADLDAFLALRAEFPAVPIHAGYMAAQFPHFDAARAVLASGRLGAVTGYTAVALQAHIMAAKPVRWEMLKAKSGGGALVNFAGHALSMVTRAVGVGPDTAIEARMSPLHSTEVEDVVEARFDHGAFRGRIFASWSVPGYARPVNRLEVTCERGRVIVENGFAEVVETGANAEETVTRWTQGDFDVGFNAAADYTGAGFSAEHRNFLAAMRGEAADGAFGVAEAVDLERLMGRIYAAAEAAGGLTATDFTDPWPGDAESDRLAADARRRMGIAK